MRPVMQTEFGVPRGDCFMAAIASVIEVELDELPNLYDEEVRRAGVDGRDVADATRILNDGGWGWDWFGYAQRGLARLGWYMVLLDADRFESDFAPAGFACAGGRSPRPRVAEAGHVVVVKDGEMVHDPHPSGDGLDGSVTEWYVLLRTVPRGEVMM